MIGFNNQSIMLKSQFIDILHLLDKLLFNFFLKMLRLYYNQIARSSKYSKCIGLDNKVNSCRDEVDKSYDLLEKFYKSTKKTHRELLEWLYDKERKNPVTKIKLKKNQINEIRTKIPLKKRTIQRKSSVQEKRPEPVVQQQTQLPKIKSVSFLETLKEINKKNDKIPEINIRHDKKYRDIYRKIDYTIKGLSYRDYFLDTIYVSPNELWKNKINFI